jgi:hypothetical protein
VGNLINENERQNRYGLHPINIKDVYHARQMVMPERKDFQLVAAEPAMSVQTGASERPVAIFEELG